MTSLENLYYAVGELAYAVAKADGKVQPEEGRKFHDIVNQALAKEKYGFDVAAIIFKIMVKDNATLPDSYYWAVKEIRRNSHYLSPALKSCFIEMMEKIASAYPPVTIEEINLIEKFK